MMKVGSLVEFVIVMELFNKICIMFFYGSIENIMQILNYQKKNPHLHTIESLHIHKEASSEYQLNDKQKIFPNNIFDATLNIGI